MSLFCSRFFLAFLAALFLGLTVGLTVGLAPPALAAGSRSAVSEANALSDAITVDRSSSASASDGERR